MNIEGIAIEKILDLFRQGKDLNYIANFYSISNKEILLQNLKTYITANSLFEVYNERIHNINLKELYDLRNNNFRNVEIAKLYDLSIAQVKLLIKKYCRQNNLEHPFFKSKKLQLNEKEIEQDFLDGMTYTNMAQKYNVAPLTIKKILLKKYTEEEIINIKYQKHFRSIKNDKGIVKIYELGFNVKEISKYCNVSKHIINKVLIEHYNVPSKRIPKVLPESVFNISNKNSSDSIKTIQLKAREASRIVPTFIVYKYNDFVIDTKKIRDYVKNYVLNNETDEETKKVIYNDINLSLSMKEKGYGTKSQISALLHHLLKNDYSNISELIDLVGRRYRYN